MTLQSVGVAGESTTSILLVIFTQAGSLRYSGLLKTDIRCVQRHSNVSELFEKLKIVPLNDTPMCRSCRKPMGIMGIMGVSPENLLKHMLKSPLNTRSRTPQYFLSPSLPSPPSLPLSPLLNDSPKCREKSVSGY